MCGHVGEEGGGRESLRMSVCSSGNAPEATGKIDEERRRRARERERDAGGRSQEIGGRREGNFRC